MTYPEGSSFLIVKILLFNEVYFQLLNYSFQQGRTESFKFIVMQLVGASVDKLQKQQPKKHFTFVTILHCVVIFF